MDWYWKTYKKILKQIEDIKFEHYYHKYTYLDRKYNELIKKNKKNLKAKWDFQIDLTFRKNRTKKYIEIENKIKELEKFISDRSAKIHIYFTLIQKNFKDMHKNKEMWKMK